MLNLLKNNIFYYILHFQLWNAIYPGLNLYLIIKIKNEQLYVKDSYINP